MTRILSVPAKLRLGLIAGMIALGSAPLAAQEAGYDANCDPRNYTDEELTQQELCKAHIGCNLTIKFAQSACKVKGFFNNLGGLLGGRSKPDNIDVFEALNQTEVPQTPGVKQVNAKAKANYAQARQPAYDRTNAAQIDYQQQPDGTLSADGKPRSTLFRFQDNKAVGLLEATTIEDPSVKAISYGVMISKYGDIRAGLKPNGTSIKDDGAFRAPDGTWIGGTLTHEGKLFGPGYKLTPDGTGQPPVLEGRFENDVPVGMMLATWPDFSSRKELWQDGKMVAAGPKVAKGQIPTNPQAPAQPQLASSSTGTNTGNGGAATAASLPASGSPGKMHAVTLVDRWAGAWENTSLLQVPESAYDQTVANMKSFCQSNDCSATMASPQRVFAYNVGNIVNPFRISGEPGQQLPQCKYTPQGGYSLPYLPGSRGMIASAGVPGEKTCAFLLLAAIHEWMENNVGGQRGAGSLASSAPVMPGTATGQCNADMQAYLASAKQIRANVSPMDLIKSLQVSLYLDLNLYRISTTSCKGTSYEESAGMYLQTAGQSLKTCQMMTSTQGVCVPKIP
ncbi:hypothetical protein [Gimibacter soli]|uniref:Uncharacterized protein n=1 Tax=Gimibacter soli TaxID=3024400 RepID=A0AAF0BLF5_9PROT|nr:hypothetical protein [Gimibacter soli]WCL53370.1 hypothetical protein PH603_12560 [Gimibacter soli]